MFLPILIEFDYAQALFTLSINNKIFYETQDYQSDVCSHKIDYNLKDHNCLMFDFKFLNQTSIVNIKSICINNQSINNTNWIYVPNNKNYLDSLSKTNYKKMKLYTQLHGGQFVWEGKVMVYFTCINKNNSYYLSTRKSNNSLMIDQESKIYYG